MSQLSEPSVVVTFGPDPEDWIYATGTVGGYTGATDDSPAERARVLAGEQREARGAGASVWPTGAFPSRVRVVGETRWCEHCGEQFECADPDDVMCGWGCASSATYEQVCRERDEA